ncbi:MAG: hypothetical protein E7575_04995 [Ruminococcaceae bacterium]|nr:hypothetical protein [Oscillospiraceae bacterium]
MPEKSVADHKAVADSGGYRFLFYCDISGAHVCTTEEIYRGETQEAALLSAWQNEGKEYFNKCHKCGRWVLDAAFNAEVLECVLCAPYECEPKFCKFCGQKISTPIRTCPSCGKKLIYEGGLGGDDAKDQI